MQKKFTGTYNRTLDSKGRLLLPPAYLQTLAENGVNSFWLTGIYGKLTAYLPAQWENIFEKLCSVSHPSPRLANFITKMIGMGQELAPDNQGRVRIPQSLIREGSLAREVVLVGIMNKFEIWDQARFDAIQVEDVSEELGKCGIDITF